MEVNVALAVPVWLRPGIAGVVLTGVLTDGVFPVVLAVVDVEPLPQAASNTAAKIIVDRVAKLNLNLRKMLMPTL
jgi:hypothetical protein